MAKGVELASAYISLSVNTSGVPAEIKKALGQGGSGARSAGDRVGRDFASGFGQNLEKGMSKAVKLGVTAATGVATAAVGGLSYTLFKGFDRYKSLDATNKRLRAMGKSGEQVKGIIADINSVVEGTPISLDAAAASATQFLAGNIKEGAELKKVLTSIADAAGFSGQSFDDLSIIFGQVMNKGKLQAEEMLQLNERNIPVQQWLQKELGVTGQELQKMSQDGQISFQNLIDAVEHNAPGMAKALGDTVDGAISNMKAAVGRVGANIFASIFGDPLATDSGPGAMAEAINKVTDRLNDMNAWISDNGDVIVDWMGNTAIGMTYLGETIAAVVAGTTRGLAVLVNAFGDTLGAMTRGVAAFNRLLGRNEIADELDRQADSYFGMADGLNATEDRMYDLAKSIGALRPGIREWRDESKLAAQFTQDLGDAAAKIKPANWWGATIIEAPTVEDIEQIKQAGFEVKAIPGSKDVEIIAVTEKATDEMNAWRRKQGEEPVVPPVQPDVSMANATMSAFVDQWTKTIIAPQVAPNTPGFTGGVGGPTNPLTAPISSNPSNSNTGGALTPETQNIQNYLRNNLGFKGDIGGWRPPDGFNEHSSGKASDVMVSSAAEGNALLPNLLRQPGVQYILWNQRQWNPDGTSSPMEDRGSPTQNHMDHLHVKTYDTGGWLPPGMTLTNNATGQPELILNPEQVKALADQGVDPNTLLHGQGQGAAPGPGVGDYTGRTTGYIPAAAGNAAPVGQGGISNFLDLGESAIHGLIDTGAQAASMAVSAAAAAGSFGAGAAAGPAASTAINMGAEAAKRGVSYLYDLGGIWSEALVEQLFPFGAPRWLGSASPTAFMPQIPGQDPGQAGGGAAAQAIQGWAQPGNPAMANGTGQEGAQAALAQAKQQPSYQAATAPAEQQTTPPPPNPLDPLSLLSSFGIFDQGGWLQPGTVGVNLSNRPEAVFTGQQFRDISKMASAWETSSPNRAAPLVGTLQAMDIDEAMRKLSKVQRLEAMTHQGRP